MGKLGFFVILFEIMWFLTSLSQVLNSIFKKITVASGIYFSCRQSDNLGNILFAEVQLHSLNVKNQFFFTWLELLFF